MAFVEARAHGHYAILPADGDGRAPLVCRETGPPDLPRPRLLYREVLGVKLPWLDDIVRAKRPVHLPVVLSREEIRAVLQYLDGVPRLMAVLLYGAGLRLLECCRLRVKDVDFATNQISIRDGKGHKDRQTMLPASVKADLSVHLERVRRQHENDLRHGAGWVELPGALCASTRTPAEPGDGSGSFRRHASTWTA